MEGDDAGLKKVLFWIHGGAFIFGGAQHYPATYIMEEDVVLVNQFNEEDSSNTVIYIQSNFLEENGCVLKTVIVISILVKNLDLC